MFHKSEPVNSEAVNTELPQLLDVVTTGGEGIGFGAATPVPAGLVLPSIVCVTVYVPAVVTVIDEVVAPLLHNKEPVNEPAVSTELSQLSTTVMVGAGGADEMVIGVIV